MSVVLALDVVSHIRFAAMEAVKALPRRGLEIGGLLLGRATVEGGRSIVQILGFLPVESEHRSGPSYLLSETDRDHFAEALRQHPEAIGMYRTNTRSENLTLQEDDRSLFDSYFKRVESVLLLIQPVTGMAQLFLRSGGALVGVHEFPFRPADLMAARTLELEAPEPEPAEVVVREQLPIAPPARNTALKRAVVAVVAVAAGAIAGAVLVQYLPHLPRRAESPAVSPAVTSVAAQAPKASAFPTAVPAQPAKDERPHLAVEREGDELRLTWNRESAAVRNATHAVVEINDGKHQSQLNLNIGELNSGVLTYRPDTRDVVFRLKTMEGSEITSAESIRAVAAPAEDREDEPRPEPAPARKATVRRRADNAEREDEDETRPSPFPSSAPTAKQGVAIVPASAAVAVVPVSTKAPDVPATARPTAPARTETPPPARTRPNYVQVTAEPVKGSRWGRMVGRIPLLKRLKKQPQAFVPPSPVRQVRPSVDERKLSSLERPIPVDVRVYVTESGKVDYAETVSGGPRGHGELAEAAVFAARRWDFSPAKLGEEKVPSEVILHFRFGPVEER